MIANRPKYYLFIVFSGLLILVGSCRKERPEGMGIDALLLPNMEELFVHYDLLDSTGNYKALAYELEMANKDLKASELYVQAAMMYYQAGETNKIAPLLHEAIDAGMANPRLLLKFPDLEETPTEEIWIKLRERLDSISEKVRNIDHFSIEMESMNLFWSYFEEARRDTSNARLILKRFIFEGPRELRDFYVVRYSNTNNMFGQMINAAPNYYSYLKHQFNTDSINAFKSVTTAWMKRFKQFYPQAVFPKVFVVPGILNSGGTATEMGMFLGGDMYGRSDSMPTEGLNDWQRESIMKFSDLPGLTLHELMHFQQNYRDSVNTSNVLRGIIEEGVCDFLVELSSEHPLTHSNLDYLEDPVINEKIMEDLREDLYSDDFSKWLYNGGAIEDRPHDLGYTLGYLITKSYYQQHENKKEAVYQLLNTDDFSKIISGSDYAYLLN